MPVDLRMSQDARCSDAAEEERRWGSSEAGGKKDGGVRGVFFFFFFFFFYIIYSLLRYKKSHGALAMAKRKPKIQNKQTKETSGSKTLQLGSVPVPGPETGAKLNQVDQGKPFLYQRTA